MSGTPTQVQVERIAAPAAGLDTEVLRGWHLARQAATRENRNLLQYAAGLAAALGISAGTGGMVALAESLKLRTDAATGAALTELPPSPTPLRETLAEWLPLVWMAVSAVVGLILLVLLVRSYRRRQRAEREVDRFAVLLIAADPERFPPRDD